MVVEQPPELRVQIGKTLHRAAAAYRPLDSVADATDTLVSLQKPGRLDTNRHARFVA
ncbi:MULTISPECIES: hypothetical protein [Pseudomonas]|uniref:hypothetical protein n=1 Tax=Pseudomonas TaxID=286 RepID=UPI0030838118